MPSEFENNEKMPLKPILEGPFKLNSQHLDMLWERFNQRVAGFIDFHNPGDELQKQEIRYKQKILARFNDELGNERLQSMINAGKGQEALTLVGKIVTSNIVSFYSWRKSFGETDESACKVLQAFLDVSQIRYEGPETVEPIFSALERNNLKPSWDTLSVVLWTLRPSDYFPIKISYYQKLAEELGLSLAKTGLTAEGFNEVINFGKAFWGALQPLKPSNWVDVQSFIWCVCPTSYGEDKIQYWAGGIQWDDENKKDEFIEGDFWQIGWPQDSDKSAAKKTWSRFNKIKIGDEFAIKGLGGKHHLNIHYIGKVVGTDTDQGIVNFEKLERALYSGDGPRGDKAGNWHDTLVPITRRDIINMIFKAEKPNGGKTKSDFPLNMILYGPPGTGKTFQTINYALSIVENKTMAEMQQESKEHDRIEILKRFNSYKSEGQIRFITFHQNYAYEDFIQGLRPDIDGGGKSLAFKLKDGVFKQIADTALLNYKASITGAPIEGRNPPFEKVFNSYFQKFMEGEQETVEIPMKRVSYKITEISEKSIFFEKHSGGTAHSLSINTLSEYYDQGRVTMVAGLKVYYKPLLGVLLDHSKTISSDASKETLKNYVMIIDEINRANISRVFGELITLIEPDKRYGQTNELRATLPSDETFSVPPNLYIIGTMNTADKSIALLDIALRRRFDFIKIYPDVSLVKENYRKLFKNINNEIIELKGPDFQIGHAYFMENDSIDFNLKSIMNKKIIPLLYEYFMNSGDTVKQILTRAGVKTIEHLGLHEYDSMEVDSVE